MNAKLFILSSRDHISIIENSKFAFLTTPERDELNYKVLGYGPHDLIVVDEMRSHLLIEKIESKELSDFLIEELNTLLYRKVDLKGQKAALSRINKDGLYDQDIEMLRQRLFKEFHEVNLADLIEKYKETTNDS